MSEEQIAIELMELNRNLRDLREQVERIADAFQAKPSPPADSVAGRTAVADD